MLSSYLFVAASCVYLAGYPENLFLKSLSPACLALLFFFPATVFAIGYSRFNAVPILSVAYATLAFLIVCWQQAYLSCYNSFFDSITSIVTPVLFFTTAWILFSREPKERLIRGLKLIL